MADPVSLPAPTSPLPWWATVPLAYLIVGAFLAICLIIVWRSDDKYEQMVLIALFGTVTGVIGYYWGSSASAAKKDDTSAASNAAAIQALATSTPASDQPPSSLVAAMVESQAAHQ